jgi:hypothetical protein
MDILKASARVGKETRSIAKELVKSLNLTLVTVAHYSCCFWQTTELAITIETK